jgi:Uma2 family endonuclease
MVITSIDQLDLEKRYTYADYLTWRFKERVELIKGHIFKMSPAPSLRHQKISGIIEFNIASFLKEKKCNMYHAPFDVRLPLPPKKAKGNKVDTVVQPDIVVVCDESKLDERGCFGAPDMVVEILSPGNSRREMRDKYDLYENAGVREYWIVDPERELVIVYQLDVQGRYFGSRPYLRGDMVPSNVLEGFALDTTEILNEPEERTW